MKTASQSIGLLLWLPILQVLALESSDSTHEAGPSYTESQSEFPDFSKATVVDRIVVPGYDGDSFSEPPASDFVPTYHWSDSKELATRDLFERQGVCLYIAQCAGKLRDFAAYYGTQSWGGLQNFCGWSAGAVRDYYTANNYAHAYAVLDGAVAGFVILVPAGVATYYLNGRIAKVEGNANTNTCGARQPDVVAEQAANGLYQFCLSIKDHVMSSTTTRYVSGDMSTNHPVFDNSDGLLIVKKFWIGSNEFDTIAVCNEFGISWRRDFNAALERGASRSIKKSRIAN